MNLGNFRKMRWVNLIICLAFCMNFGFSQSALAFEKNKSAPERLFMLRPNAALKNIEGPVFDLLNELNKTPGLLEDTLADVALAKTPDPVVETLRNNGIEVIKKGERTFIICHAEDWYAELKHSELTKVNFNSDKDKQEFISGSPFQRLWVSTMGNVTPRQIHLAEIATNAFIREAGNEGRIFTEDDLEEQVREYARKDGLSPEEETALLAEGKAAIDFRKKAIESLTQEEILEFFKGEENVPVSLQLSDIKAVLLDDLTIRKALIYDRDGKIFFSKIGDPTKLQYLAVTASSGTGFAFKGFKGDFPRSTFEILGMNKSYREMYEAGDQDALKAYKAKVLLHEYAMVSQRSKVFRQERQEIRDLITKYDHQAIIKWIERQAEKTQERKAKEESMVITEAFRANIGPLLTTQPFGATMDALLAEATDALKAESIFTEVKADYRDGILYFFTNRPNKEAIVNSPKALPAIVNAFLKVLAKAKDNGIYSEDKLAALEKESLRNQINVLNLERLASVKSLEPQGWAKVVFGQETGTAAIGEVVVKMPPVQERALSPLTEEDKAYAAKMRDLGFELLEVVGTRGEIVTYKAKDAQGKIVAVKISQFPKALDYSNDEEVKAMLAKLGKGHPNVEKPIQAGELVVGENKLPDTYIVAEYIPGQTLSGYLASLNKPADFNGIMRIIDGIMAGQRFLSEAGVRPYAISSTNTVLSSQTQEPAIIYYLLSPRFTEELAVRIGTINTLFETAAGFYLLSLNAEKRAQYKQDARLILKEVTRPRYGQGRVAIELANLLHAYLNQKEGYVSVNDIYQKLKEVQAAQDKPLQRAQVETWQEFEQREISGREISQQRRNLSAPVRIAFNIDTFAADQNVVLYGGLNRIFDSMFRLLDGNPNFAPTAIFLGEYASGIPSGMQRLAEFLKSNPALGNAKYKVQLQKDKLIINGREIALVQGLATPEKLKEFNVDVLVEATRQRYLDTGNREFKEAEEREQALRISGYLHALTNLKVAVIAPEEDKGKLLTAIPLVNRVNTSSQLDLDSRLMVFAEPVTAVSGLMAQVLDSTVKAQNPRGKIQVVGIEAIRTDRQGNRLVNKMDTRAGLALNKVNTGNPNAQESQFPGRMFDTAVMPGANAIILRLRVDGYLPSLTKEMINNAFVSASNAALKGMIDFKGKETASSFETFNPNLLIFVPEETFVKEVRDGEGAPYRTVELKGYYSETGYAKQILDTLTAISLYEGNEATTEEKILLEAPSGAIPATPERIRLQVVPDGEPVPVVINSARGRIGVNLQRLYWNNPNFKIVGINGVRDGQDAQETTAVFMQDDQVMGRAPYTVEVTPDKKHFRFTDRQERTVVTNEKTHSLLSVSHDEELHKIITPYGNLLVRLSRLEADGKLKIAMRLHGEDVIKMNYADNKDGTGTVQGKLENGTTVTLTYILSKPFIVLLSAGVKKQEIIPFSNVRPDEKAMTPGKKEKLEDFLAHFRPYQGELARNILVKMPWLNKNVMFDEGSGQLTEGDKVHPYLMGGAGRGLISAPAKATIPGSPATDLTSVPAANTEAILQVWELLSTSSCASCTTNAAATGAKAFLQILSIISGHFDTIHAITNTQGSQFGDLMKGVKRSVDGRGNIVYESTGASTELGRAITELLNSINGVALRVGNDDGSLVNYDFQVLPRDGAALPSAEEINRQIKILTETPELEGGLKGSLGYGKIKTSLEVVGTEFGGVFDPSMTVVNPQTGTVTIGIWYDNEMGYTHQYIILNLLLALQQRELESIPEIIAQNVVPVSGGFTSRVSVENAQKAGATGAIIGSGQFRTLEEEANRKRTKPVDVNAQVNGALKKALGAGMATPIFNLFISQQDQQQNTVISSINRQIAEGLKDIPAEDVVRLTVSLEAADAADIVYYIESVRRAISGYVAQANKNNIELGETVAARIRVALKLNNQNLNSAAIEKLAMAPGVGGVILPAGMVLMAGNGVVKKINSAILSNPQKRKELNTQINPRFLLCVSRDMVLNEEEMQSIINSGVDTYYIQVAVAPVLPQIREFSSLLKGEKLVKRDIPAHKVPVRILAQNAILGYKEGFVNLEELVSHQLIHDLLLGHSEVVELTGITPEEIAKTLKRAHQLKGQGRITGNIVAAVGETENDYLSGRSKEIVVDKVLRMLQGLTPEEAASTVIAYEPIWAIGTGRTPTPQEVQEMHATIKSAIKAKFGLSLDAYESLRVIYGGSVTSQNVEQFVVMKDVDGVLPGGASTKAKEFREIAKIVEKVADQKNARRRQGQYKKMYVAGNHKTYAVTDTLEDFVRLLSDVDRGKVEVAIGPDLSNITKLSAVYTREPLEGIVTIDQLNKEEIYNSVFYARPDFNLPINDAKANPGDPRTWEITNYSRIDSVVPEIKYISDKGGILVLMAHFEPKGQNLKDPQSIRFLLPLLEQRLGRPVNFISKPGSAEHYSAIASARPGDIFLMENLRLDPAIAKLEKADGLTKGKEEEDRASRNRLAAQLYVGKNSLNPTAGVVKINMGMGVMHRNQGSVTGEAAGVPMLIGRSLAKEIQLGTEAIRNAQHPAMIIFGGGPKISDKIPMLKNIILNSLTKGDKLFVVGGAAIPFLTVMKPGFEAGLSKVGDEKILAAAEEIVRIADEEGIEIVTPVDFVVADRLPTDENEQVMTRIVKDIPASMGYYDIGPKTIGLFRETLLDNNGKSRLGTIIVNGPAGVFEYEQFQEGTKGLYELLAKATKGGAITVLGGADTGAAVELLGMKADDFSLVSTGGGAFLELLEGLGLPGVEALRNKGARFAYKLNPRTIEGFLRVRKAVSDYAAENGQGIMPAPVVVNATPLGAPAITLPSLSKLADSVQQEWVKANLGKEYFETLLALQDGQFMDNHSKDVFDAVKDGKEKVILISLRDLMDTPSLIFDLMSSNEQMNQSIGVDSPENIAANAYRFIAIADVPGTENMEGVEKLFNKISRKIGVNAQSIQALFADILPWENIKGPAALVKQLKRMGIELDKVAGLVGSEKWIAAIKAQDGILKDAIEGRVDAGENQIALGGKVLFGVIEAVATTEGRIPVSVAQRLDLRQEATAQVTTIRVVSKELVPIIADEIESYRKQLGV